jgi:WD40 repeat protein
MSAIDKGAAPGPRAEPSVSAHGDPPAGQVRFDAFISYRRIAEDTAFVDHLQEALAARGKNVWVDRAKIEPAADWSKRIARGIEAAKAFIFVITPESVVSEECLRELELAAQQHKLVIPVVLRDVAARRDLPQPLSRPNWIFFSHGREDARALDDVVQALEEDLDWRDAHTRLAVRTKEWADAQRDRSFLLRGSDLRVAEEWMAQAPLHSKTPPTMQQTEYILAGRKASVRTQRTWQAALSVGLVVALALAAFAFLQRQQAIHQRDVAASGLLANQSQVLDDTDPSLSKLESIAAWRIYPSPGARYAMLAAAARPGIAVLTGHRDTVDSVAFSPDGKMLASGGFDDGTVRLWEVATHKQIGPPLPSGDVRVWSVAFSPDGTMLASGQGRTVRLWNVATHRQIGSPLDPHTDTLAYSVAFSPDSTTLAVAYFDSVVRLWDVATHQQIGSPLSGHTGEVDSVAFSPDGKILASGGSDHTVRLWDMTTNRQIGRPLLTGPSTLSSVAVSPDGKTLASGNQGGVIRLWDVATHQQIGSPLTGLSDYVESVAFSPNGKMLASGGDAMVQLWKVATGQQIGFPLTVPSGAIASVAFSPNGKVLASSGQDGTVRLWDVATSQQIGRPLPGPSALYSVAFSPDGTMVASGDGAGTVRLWQVATHKQIGGPLTGPIDIVNSVAFSSDGTILATGSRDDTVRLWNVATHRQIGELIGPSPVNSMAFSPDGTILATGDDSGMVHLWDRATGQQFGGLVAGSASPVDSVAFGPGGKMLASGSEDGTVRLWDVAYLPDIVHYLCASVGRSLTPAEWASYIPSGPGYQALCP